MPVLVNQSKTAQLIGCSRNNINKKWKLEQDKPGTYDYFSDTGSVDISHPDFIEQHGDHITEWESIKDLPRGTAIPRKETVKPITTKPATIKPRSNKQIEQDEIKAEPATPMTDEMKELAEKAKKSKYIKTINDAKKSQIELDKSRSVLIEIETLGETCMGYLATLNQNAMQIAETFVDEFEAAMKTKKTRSTKIDILRKPICDMIAETMDDITKELDRERKKAYRHERKTRTAEKI